MTYSTTYAPACIAQRVGANGGALWMHSNTDSISDVLASGYITNGYDLGMRAGDAFIHIDETNAKTYYLSVGAVVTDGAASVSSDQNTLELTASGAVTPGTQYVELNHATVVIAATIADFADHVGTFVVKDTSASGTAAHTLTLTSGTFDGTNNVATLDAPGERLVVLVGDDGNGVIIENTGSVGLS